MSSILSLEEAQANILAMQRQLAEDIALGRAQLDAQRQDLEARTSAAFQAIQDASYKPDAPTPVRRTPQTAPLPSSVKVQTPRDFSGSRSGVPTFIYEVELYTKQKQLYDSVMTLVPSLLRGVSADWWQSLESEGAAPDNWTDFKTALIFRFGDPKLPENMREALAALKPGRTATALRNDLERILVHLPGLPEDERVYQFKSKLKASTRYAIEQKNIQTLREAYDEAENVERAARMCAGVGFSTPGTGRVSRFSLDRPRSTPWSGNRDQGPVPMELCAMRGDQSRGRPPLSAAEKQRLRDNHGCFYCRVANAGHYSDQCDKRPAHERSGRSGNGRGRGR